MKSNHKILPVLWEVLVLQKYSTTPFQMVQSTMSISGNGDSTSHKDVMEIKPYAEYFIDPVW